VVVVVNLSDRQWQEDDYGIHMDGEIGRWEEIFNSQSPQYDGWNDSGNYGRDLQVQADGQLYINLPKWSILIFRKQ
jgi:1,4-alpha-glucan branching enzyme